MKSPIALPINLPIDRIEKFCQHWQIIELSLFGSILYDGFHGGSDIDSRFSKDIPIKINDWLKPVGARLVPLL